MGAASYACCTKAAPAQLRKFLIASNSYLARGGEADSKFQEESERSVQVRRVGSNW
jgi:hypothetical protein